MKLLKLGKQVADEFFLLTDYKLDEIEQSAQFGDILDLYNLFDDSIERFSAG